MKLKKILAGALALAMALAMTACGEDSKDPDDWDEEDFESAADRLDNMDDDEIESLYDEAEKKLDGEETTTAAAGTGGIVPTEEILSADVYSGKIQMGNHVFDTPLYYNVGELAAMGFEITEDSKPVDLDTTIISPSQETVTGLSGKDVDVTIDGVKYRVRIYNYTEDRQLAKDCWINMQIFSDRDKLEFVYPKGIMVGSTVDELLAAFGEPTVQDIDRYYYYENYVQCKGKAEYKGLKDDWFSVGSSYDITVDLTTNTISSISFSSNQPNEEQSRDYSYETVYYSYLPEYKYVRNESTYSYWPGTLYENGGNTFMIDLSWGFTGGVEKHDYGTYDDESLTAFCEGMFARKSDKEKYSYTYEINGDTAVAIIVENKGGRAEADVIYLTDDGRYTACEDVLIFPCGDVTEVTAADIEAAYPLLLSLGKTIRVEDKQ